jgi:competence protein ComFB
VIRKDTEQNRTDNPGDGMSDAGVRTSGALPDMHSGINSGASNHVTVIDETSALGRLSDEIRRNLEREYAAGDEKKKDAPRFQVINLMCELLCREDITGTMKKFGMCTCGQCRARVIARCLSSLPSEYIVVKEGTGAAEVSLRGNQYAAAVKKALLKACSEVKTNPCHDGRGAPGV